MDDEPITQPAPELPADAPARRSTDLPPDAPWWMRWIVANWNDGWKWLSVQWPIICGGFIEVYTTYADQLSKYVPATWLPHLAAAAFWIGAALRFVNQAKKEKP